MDALPLTRHDGVITEIKGVGKAKVKKILKELLFSSISFTKPVPSPMSSTIAKRLKFKGIDPGNAKVIEPVSTPPIGIIFKVVVVPNN